MLSLQLKSGDYITIGKDVVVQVFKQSGPDFRVAVKAPREVPVLRGELLERGGGERPEGMCARPLRKPPSAQIHDAQRLERLVQRQQARQKQEEGRRKVVQEMRAILDRLSGSPALDGEIQELRRALERVAELER